MVKYLTIDEQTISDLAIFGKSGKASVYDLYNKTITQGGGAKLEELFRHPLADDTAINVKTEIFKYFSLQEYAFPIDSETMGALAYYLENEDVRSQLQLGNQSLSQRFKDMVAADSDQVFVHDGVQASLRLFYKLSLFIKQVENSVQGSAYESSFNKLVELVNASEFAGVRQHASSKFEVKLSAIVMAELDKQVRFEYRDKILELLDLLYDLDVFIAVGQVARKRGFHFAKAMPKDSGALNYKGVYHPHVEGAIANDLYLNSDHNILFLTGANMAVNLR